MNVVLDRGGLPEKGTVRYFVTCGGARRSISGTRKSGRLGKEGTKSSEMGKEGMKSSGMGKEGA